MENGVNNLPENMEGAVSFDIHYGIEQDIDRVNNTLRKLWWYKENGYSIEALLGLSENSTENEVADAVIKNFSENSYSGMSESLKDYLQDVSGKLEDVRANPSMHLLHSYGIVLTRYGTGGSYHAERGEVIVNIENKNVERVVGIIIHEIIHTAIQYLINKYNIRHWQKERLVDHLVEQYFPGIRKKQKIDEDVAIVDQAFKKHFPDIEAVAQEIAEQNSSGNKS